MKSHSTTRSVKSGKTPGKKKLQNSNGSNHVSQLRGLFEDQLKDMYWAEKALTKALPKMSKKATSGDLVNAIHQHLLVTEEHVKRIERIFQSMDKKALAKKCDAMEGLIKEGEGIISETVAGVVRDAGIIAAAQKVEHYEIASYGTLHAFARTLGMDDAASLLEQILQEEKEADKTLTQIAESNINAEAAHEV